jgi:class 3 adenylate cyclase
VIVHRTRRPIEDEELALERAGLRFRDPATETAFRQWFALEAVAFIRLAIAASAVGWLAAWVGLGLAIPRGFGPSTPWTATTVPLLSIAYLATRHPGRAMLVICGVVNAISGVIAVWGVSFGVLDSPALSSLVLVLYTFFAFTIFRFPPSIGAAAVAVYGVVHQALVVRAHHRGTLSTTDAWIDSTIPWVAYVIGVLVCCVLIRLSRDAYRRERIIDKQQQVIAAERERSDALLRNVLPDPVAERLKVSDEPIADFFPEVTVLFADICGFTRLATRVPPRELVELLNEVFSRFDALTAACGAEKIKTIGDAYMVVAGIPEPRADHVEAIADLALEMRAAVADLDDRTGAELQCRLGIATGPAVAGVIGQKRFAYDLWGNTVNMAARMESHGVAGRIQVTSAVCERLHATHVLEPRGCIEVKGVGPTETWFLERRRPRPRPHH